MLGSNRKFLVLIIGLIVIFVVLAWLKPRNAQQDAVATGSNGVSIQTWETDNGARVLFVSTKQLPMLDVRVVFDAGSARDGQKPGLARLTNLLLVHGAGEWDTDTIAERFEDVGATYGAQASRDMAVVSLRSLVDEPLLEQALTTLERLADQGEAKPGGYRCRVCSRAEHAWVGYCPGCRHWDSYRSNAGG